MLITEWRTNPPDEDDSINFAIENIEDKVIRRAKRTAKKIEAKLKKFANAKVEYDVDENVDDIDDSDRYIVNATFNCKIDVSLPIDELDEDIDVATADDSIIDDFCEKYLKYCVQELDKNIDEYDEGGSIESSYIEDNQLKFSLYYRDSDYYEYTH